MLPAVALSQLGGVRIQATKFIRCGMRSRFSESAMYGVGYGWLQPSAPDRRRRATWCCRRWCGDDSANCWPRECRTGSPTCFFLGLLSLIDVMLEMPMADVLERISLDHATKAVLLGGCQPPAPGVPADAGS